MQQLVDKQNFDNIKMHSTNVKIMLQQLFIDDRPTGVSTTWTDKSDKMNKQLDATITVY